MIRLFYFMMRRKEFESSSDTRLIRLAPFMSSSEADDMLGKSKMTPV